MGGAEVLRAATRPAVSVALATAAGILGGLAVAAFFAACEGAFFQLTVSGGRESSEGESRLQRLLARPERLQSALELGHLLGVVWTAALTWAWPRRTATAPRRDNWRS